AQLFLRVGPEVSNGFDQIQPTGQIAVAAHRIKHRSKAVVATLKQGEQAVACPVMAGTEVFVEKLEFMSKIADFADIGHPCTTFEGVQVPLQCLDLEAVVDISHPALQRQAGTLDDVKTFLKEYLYQLRIALLPACCINFGELRHRLIHNRLRQRLFRLDLVIRHPRLNIEPLSCPFNSTALCGCRLRLNFAYEPSLIDQAWAVRLNSLIRERLDSGRHRNLCIICRRIDLKVRRSAPTIALNTLNQRQAHVHRLIRLQLFQLYREQVVAAQKQCSKLRGVGITPVGQTFIERFQLKSQITDGPDGCHSCAALEGMQITYQCGQSHRLAGIAQPP